VTKPVIIEAAINGNTSPARNPHAPGSPEEIARQAVECIDLGASIIHIHNAQMNNPWERAAELYAQALRPMRQARPKAVLYPTLGTGATIEDRFRHNSVLAARGLQDMAALDPGSTNLAATGADGALPMRATAYVNAPSDIAHMFSVCDEHKIGPNMAIYEPGFLRAVIAYHRAGKLPAGSLTKFYFSGKGYDGDGYPFFSAPPIREALDLYVAMLGDHDLPWAVALLGGDLLDTPVARLAVERGGHIRVGLEDNPDGPANTDMVRRAIALCREVGRPIATAEETRAILGLQPASA
jgi:uncharacterized protein (DUF849 family)